MSDNAGSWQARAARLWLREVRHLLPPTIYFFVAFNLIVHTTNLLTRTYLFAVEQFFTTTLLALLVGKAVLVADKIRAIHRFRGQPLIRPIFYKTLFYCSMVVLFRIVEQLFRFALDSQGFSHGLEHWQDNFTWHRFAAINIWLFTCFLIYVTANEISAALGPGKLKQMLFGRP